MFKTFALFGMICVFDPDVKIFQENCFNIWEEPGHRYKTLHECDNAGTIGTLVDKKKPTIKKSYIFCIFFEMLFKKSDANQSHFEFRLLRL